MSAVCRCCGTEIIWDPPCAALQFSQLVGRAGRHSGRCWGGLFPQKEDFDPDDLHDAHELTKLEAHEQLTVWHV
jgi:hypothetical protein